MIPRRSKADFEEAYKGALGANINLESSTFQGQMITNDTATLTKAMNEVVNIANSFSVYTATGQALDVAAAFSDITANRASVRW